MKTISDILKASVLFLQERGVDRARFTAESLIASCLQLKRMDLYLQFDRPVLEEELALIRPLLKRASLKEPVEYIIPHIAFHQAQLTLSKDVLIPRQETEILVDWMGKSGLAGELDVWDVCTGSGCIGIALKKMFPEFRVAISDLSSAALEVARQNVLQNQVEIEVCQGDLLAPFQGRQADVIVCNPPYVSLEEYVQLEESVRLFEPKQALVGGEDGLLYYRRLQEELPVHLKRQAKIFLEIGASQGEAIRALFSAPYWKKQRIEKDWSGQDRFFFLEFE